MNTLKSIALFLVVSAMTAFGAQGENRIIIDPTLDNYDSFPEIKSMNKFFVDSVRDTLLGRADSGLVGYTHTRSKSPTAIICRPLPAAAIDTSLEKLFAKKGIAAANRGEATYLVRVTLLSFDLKETPHFLHQTMDATVRFKIDLIDPRTSQLAQGFTVESQRSRTTFNANRKSEQILSEALENALVEVIKTLKGI